MEAKRDGLNPPCPWTVDVGMLQPPDAIYVRPVPHMYQYLCLFRGHRCISILTVVDAEHSSHREQKIERSTASALR